MEAFASAALLARYVLADGLEPVRRVRLEQLRVVGHDFEDEDLDVEVDSVAIELVQQVLCKLRHLFLLLPLFSEERLHPLDASFDVLHAPVRVHLVQLELALLVWDVLALPASRLLSRLSIFLGLFPFISHCFSVRFPSTFSIPLVLLIDPLFGLVAMTL